ncbi:MAG: S24 family peptidase [Gammaproteobacteria bacterium]|nr:S24 family peptidase [Gammaproteobacteria bacterium]MDH5734964.1 S24 family peptidase [Gammaproteobacteria bacterium]
MQASSCSKAEPFALQVLGDSMQPEFMEGVVIIVDPEGVLRDGCYVVAVHNDEYTFRQYRLHEERHYLVPLNDLYETEEFAGPSAVKGVVIQQAGKRRKDRKFY